MRSAKKEKRIMQPTEERSHIPVGDVGMSGLLFGILISYLYV